MKYLFTVILFFFLCTAKAAEEKPGPDISQQGGKKQVTQSQKENTPKQLQPFVPSQKVTADSVISLPTDI